MLAELRQAMKEGTLDAPIVPLLEGFAALPCCYTIQSCWGHFVHELQPETKNLDSLKAYVGRVGQVLYRIAYLALCIERSSRGFALHEGLRGIASKDPEFVHFGSTEFFWRMVPNTYVIQVAPDWGKGEDSLWIPMEEALVLEQRRNRFFRDLEMFVSSFRASEDI